MEYSKLISVTGLGGLYEMLASKTDGAIVRSLDDKSTRFISSRQHSFSHLESIEVYTQHENVNLVDIFRAMQASAEALPSEKDAAAVKSYFAKVYPELDFDRVYISDMKKMVRWYGILKAADVALQLSSEAEEESTGAVTETAPESTPEPEAAPAEAAEKPKKKAARKEA